MNFNERDDIATAAEELGDDPPSPLGQDVAGHWSLRPGLAFLNHGSFGAVPRAVAEEQERWRQRIEADPVEMIARHGGELLDQSKAALGGWLGMKPPDFGLVTNATEGVNAVLRSMELAGGDELLTTNHVYNAIRQTMRYVTRRSGASYREVKIPLPILSPDDVAQRVVQAIGPRTRLLVIDHVTSPTALIFPMREIIGGCNKLGVDVLVDGAHAPGMLDLNVAEMGAAYYAGNLHKWTCTPRGCGFLWVRPDRQSCVHPTVISHRLDEGFAQEFGWQGTRDLSAWLAAPRAIAFMGQWGWDNVRRHNHAMAAWAHRLLCRSWRVPPLSPLDGSMLGSMATVALPDRLAELPEPHDRAIQQRLHDEFDIEVPIMRWEGRNYLRVSSQVYNEPRDYRRVAAAILKISGEHATNVR